MVIHGFDCFEASQVSKRVPIKAGLAPALLPLILFEPLLLRLRASEAMRSNRGRRPERTAAGPQRDEEHLVRTVEQHARRPGRRHVPDGQLLTTTNPKFLAGSLVIRKDEADLALAESADDHGLE